jgi:hypothetical protein
MGGRPSRREAAENENLVYASDAATVLFGAAKDKKKRLQNRYRLRALVDSGELASSVDAKGNRRYDLDDLRAWLAKRNRLAPLAKAPIELELPRIEPRVRELDDDPHWRKAVEDAERDRAARAARIERTRRNG